MRFLSARRRHPLAGFAVVLLGLIVTAGLYSALRPAAADESAKSDAQLIEEGRKLYVVGCSTCHGLSAEGVLTKRGSNYGPPLRGVGAAAVDFQVSTGRMPMARPDTQAPDREEVYKEDEVAALAAYIASLGPGPAIPSDEDLDYSNANAARGLDIYLTNCAACHNYAGAGGALRSGRWAPDLMDATPKEIYEALLTGPQQMPVFSDEVITPDDKRDIIAYIVALQTENKLGGAGLGNKGPVNEGLAGWLVGIGSLVLVAVWIANNGARAGKTKA